jgi:predicted DNA-binding transcriptional regulator AlpA
MKPERIKSTKVASILGLTAQTVREMAAHGELPSSAKLCRHWTFNEKSIRKWLRARETAQRFAAKARQAWLNRSPQFEALNLEAYELAIGRKPSRLT